MGVKKLVFNVPNGTTQGWVCPIILHKRWHIVAISFGFNEFQGREVAHLVIAKKFPS